jgi:GntR family transcriptional regulator, phosphonate transport system regulatory protein
MASIPRGKRPQPQAKSAIGGGRAGEECARYTSWLQAARRLELEIEGGRFAEGARLPTELVLSSHLGVNRHTLRRAIEALVMKGCVRRIPHVGTFVAPKRVRFAISSEPTAAVGLDRFGLKRGHNVLSHRHCRPPVEVARLLGVAQRTEVIEVVHISTANKAPFSHVTTWLPADRFRRVGEIMEGAGNVREALGQLGVGSPRRKTVQITSRRASKAEASLLDLPANASVLVLDSLSVDPAGEPTHVSQCVIDAGRVELIVEL